MHFRDRREAGRLLAARLGAYAHQPQVVVLALPRGGVPVGFEVAQALAAPLDVFLVRKLGVPVQPELAMGAVASSGICLINPEVVQVLGIADEVVELATREAQQELKRRESLYRGDRPPADVSGRVVILVDDGLATGASIRAAVAALRRQKPARIVVAVPVGAPETCAEVQAEVDELVCLHAPDPFISVGQWYGDFSQTTDEEVHEFLQQAAEADEHLLAHGQS